MKKLLSLLFVLIVVPAWAGDETPVTQPGVSIELKGSIVNLSSLVTGLEKEAVYKEAGCASNSEKKSAETATISCAKAAGALLTFLSKNAHAVHWSISAATTTPMGCAAGCAMMNCPPPTGPVVCCNTSTHKAC